MPAEIDTDGPRVLHCDSRADCPTTPTNNVPTSAGRQRRAERAHSSCRSATSLADLGRGSAARLPRIIRGPIRGSPDGHPKDPRREIVIRARRANARPVAADDGEEEEGGRDVLAESRHAATRGGNGLTCPPGGRVSRALGNVSKDECLSVTRNCREGARSARDKVERAESRLRGETERSPPRRAIARRRSLQDRSWPLRGGPLHRPVGSTRAVAGSPPLLSSHHSRSKVRSCREEDGAEDTSEGFPGERLASDDGGDTRCSRDERPEEGLQTGRLGSKDSASRRGRRVRSLLRLAFLLFLVAFGPSGLLGRSARKFSAGPSCASVVAIGTIIGAVSAAPVDLIGDAGIRAERSANLSHITGASRKIQMYVKNRHLQILPDGTVNGSNDDTSDYSEYDDTTTTTLPHVIAR